MALKNKLGITDSLELARAEERISKTRALELFEKGIWACALGTVFLFFVCRIVPVAGTGTVVHNPDCFH